MRILIQNEFECFAFKFICYVLDKTQYLMVVCTCVGRCVNVFNNIHTYIMRKGNKQLKQTALAQLFACFCLSEGYVFVMVIYAKRSCRKSIWYLLVTRMLWLKKLRAICNKLLWSLLKLNIYCLMNSAIFAWPPCKMAGYAGR